MRSIKLGVGLIGAAAVLVGCSSQGGTKGPGGLEPQSLEGMWTLTITPVERSGMSLRVERVAPAKAIDMDKLGDAPPENVSPTVDIEISTRLGSLSGCAANMRKMPTECDLENGVLAIRMGGDGEPTMVATMDSGDERVLTGKVRLESPGIPGGGIDFGTARMVRKE